MLISATRTVSRRGIRKDYRRRFSAGWQSARPSQASARLVADFERANITGLRHKELMTINRNIGMLLLAIYLILVGIVAIAGVAIPSVLTGVLALLAGIFILIGR
jgi:hypothetical protein